MSAEPPVTPKVQKSTVFWLVKVWFIFHCIMCFCWSMPGPPNSVRSGKRKGALLDQVTFWNEKAIRSSASPLRFYMTATGFWQYWDMFAPDPLQTDYYVSAQVTFKNGTVVDGYYPHIGSLNIAEKLPYERFRKYLERGASDNNQYLWPYFAQRIALVSWVDPNNPPLHVALIKHLRKIGPPEHDEDAGKFETRIYFDYDVDQPKLKAAKGKF